MSTNRLVRILGVLVALGALAFGALFLEYDATALGQKLLDRAMADGTTQVRAGGFRLSPARGFKLEDVRVVSSMPSGDLTLDAEKIVLEHQLWPLILRRELVVDGLSIERPQVVLREKGAPAETASGGEGGSDGSAGTSADGSAEPQAGEAAEAEEAAGGGTGIQVQVAVISLTDGSFETIPAGPPVLDAEGNEIPTATVIRGLDLELRDLAIAADAASLVGGLSATGEMAAEEVVTGATRATEVQGDLHLEGGRVSIRELVFPMDLGQVTVASLDVDLNTDPYTFTLDAKGNPLDTNHLLGAAADGGFGASHLVLEVDGDATVAHLAGGGNLAFEGGTLADTPLFAKLQELLVGVEVIGSAYEPFKIDYAVRGRELVVQPFEIVAAQLTLGAEGTIGLDGPLSLSLYATVPRGIVESDIKEIPKEAIEFLTDTDGRVRLPIKVHGTQVAPEVGFDSSAWKKMLGKRVQQEIKKEAGKLFKKLLGGEG